MFYLNKKISLILKRIFFYNLNKQKSSLLIHKEKIKVKLIAKNKFARSDYEIIDEYEAGIALQGWEVKSIRNQNVNLKNSFCSFKNHELFVSNLHISSWMLEKNDELRSRKLLLHKNQLLRIQTKVNQQRLVIIPLMIGWSNGKIKLLIALAKARNKVDKRQAIKELETKKYLNKHLK